MRPGRKHSPDDYDDPPKRLRGEIVVLLVLVAVAAGLFWWAILD